MTTLLAMKPEEGGQSAMGGVPGRSLERLGGDV